MTNSNIDKQIKQIEKEAAAKIAKLKAAAIAAQAPDDIKEIATTLHDIQCHQNHIDGCAWYYDKGDWSHSVRQDYLAKAVKLKKEIPELTPTKCTKLHQILRGHDV